MSGEGGGMSGRASGGQLEERVDLSSETDARLQQAEQLTTSGQLHEALALLAALEKRCRVGNDNASLIRVCEASLRLCRQANDQEALITTLQTLSAKRSQKTAAVKALVQTAMPWCLNEPYEPVAANTPQEKENRDKLVMALREITDGKIFLERERAQLTRVLATIKEQEGDVAGAADVLQEVYVETYGSISKRDKVEFILEQMRLTLAKRDYVRAAIVAGKVSRKHLSEENMEEHKVRFFALMTVYHRHSQDALELAKDYYAVYSTPHVLRDPVLWREALQSTVLFLALSPHSNEQQDLLNRINQDTNVEQLPACQSTIQLLLKKEIINYPIPHQADLESSQAFQEGGTELAQHWRETLHRRVIHHNVRVASLYYKRIHGARLAQLLQLDPVRLESEIAVLVSDGSVYAKIDRPNDIVRFSAHQTPESILSDWASGVDKLLHLLETTTHLIHKETMTSQ